MRSGLDALDRRYLSLIAESFGGGPVGIETIAAALSEPRDAIEEIVEPFLIQQGLVQRTPRGRMLSAAAFRHLGLPCRSATGRRCRSSTTATMSPPIEIVAAVIRDGPAATLLVRKQDTAVFMQPGGKREPGEDDLTALARELDEELGLAIVAGSVRSLGTFRARAANETGREVVAAVYEVAVAGEPAPAPRSPKSCGSTRTIRRRSL